jgi:RHS repeat-associated protein
VSRSPYAAAGWLFLLTLLSTPAWATVCDVDVDGDVDIDDIRAITAARNSPAAGPDDPRDPDRDGLITVLDARQCVLQCDLARCAVPAANTPPVADAGPDRSAFVGDTVTLDGSGASDADGDPLTYAWTLAPPAGSAAALDDPGAVAPTFTLDVPGDYLITLVVNDGTVDSAPDTVVVSTRNSAPVADAGPDAAALVGETVTLDGSGSSDVDGDPLTFAWSLVGPAGSSAALDDPAAVSPRFTVDLPGDYTATLVVNDGALDSAPDAVLVSTVNTPPVADAGPDQAVFVGDAVTLDGSGSSDVDGDALTYFWSLSTVPAGSTASLDDPNAVAPTFTVDASGTYVLQLVVNDGLADSPPDTVTVSTLNRAPVADAGPDRAAFVGETVTLDGTGSADPEGDPLSYAWSLLSVPPGSAAALTMPASATPTFPIDVPGTYVAQLVVNDGALDSSPDTVVVATTNRAPLADAGPDAVAFTGASVTLDGTASADPDGDALTWAWVLITIPPGSAASLDDPTAPTPSFTLDLLGDYVAQLTVNDGSLDGPPDTVRISAQNRPPSIDSTPPPSVDEGALYAYDVLASDPDGGDVLRFELRAGPAGATLDPVTGALRWTASPAGSAAFTVAVVDLAGAEATQAFTVTVAPGNRAPTIDSTAPTTATVGAPYAYDVEASDPDVGDVLTFSLPLAPAGMSIDPASGLIAWTPAAGQEGDAPVTVRVSDGAGAFAEQSFVVTVEPAGSGVTDFLRPVVELLAAPDTVPVGSPIALTVSATDDDRVVTRSLAIDGVDVPLAPDGTATFTAPLAGLYTAVATATDPAGNLGSAERELRVLAPGDGTPPGVALTAPAVDAVVSAPVEVRGTANDAALVRYELELARVGTGAFVTVATGSAPVVNDVLGTLDPSAFRNGLFELRLTAEDASGNVASTSRTVQLDGELKVGAFSLSFDDMTVPVAGIPIVVTREYDSRDRSDGELGYGWRIDLKTITVDENRVPGSGWETFCAQPLLFGCIGWGVRPAVEHRVIVTRPDGETDEFRIDADFSVASSQTLIPGTLVFVPLPGTDSTLQALGGATFDLISGGELVDFSFETIDPQRYRLTDPDGVVFDIDQVDGLERIVDANGNTMTFGPGGIIHSAGRSVVFTRDGQGRITRIEDPRGNAVTYAYDGYGDLVEVVDRLGEPTRFLYNSAHGLLEVIDPRGVRATRNDYDDLGRLVAVTDPRGNRITFDRDVEGRQEVVTDRLGRVRVLAYDDRGNVTSETRPDGSTITRTFDARDNELTETDPLGNVTSFAYDARDNVLSRTDPLGNVERFTYDSGNRQLTDTDPNGNVFRTSYDAAGNILSNTDGEGNVTQYAYDGSGNRIRETDALGRVHTWTYNAFGDVIGETDRAGNVISYEVDANGNRLTETRTRTVDGVPVTMVTRHEYDALDRVIRTERPDGSVETFVYDGAGNLVQETDGLGRVTAHEYDDLNRRIATVFPDGTRRSRVFDAEGQLLESTDRAGRTTRYEYDAVGRLVREVRPDGSAIAFAYDPAGRQTSRTDALGNTETRVYDAAGRRTQVTDALGAVTAFTYDANGNLATVTDPAGAVTTFAYDANSRLVRRTFPDGTQEQLAYDALSRPISTTDEAGRSTTVEYDERDLLVGLIDALGNRWSFAYDEVGNRVSQTDPNGRVTRFAYDDLGRETGRTLPGGLTRTQAYDAEGNVVSVTDYSGAVTLHQYDVNDRLVRRDRADGTVETFTWTPEGQRESATDGRGTTAYTYDALDRLLRVDHPDGSRIAYGYDAVGNAVSLDATVGSTLVERDFNYDAVHRLVGVDDPDSGLYGLAYDSRGNPVTQSHPNGVTTSYAWDVRSRLTGLTTRDGASTVLQSHAYTLGPAGNRERIDEGDGTIHQYTYDAVYRLTGETVSGGPAPGYQNAYSYDAVGNRLSRTFTDGGLPTVEAYTYDERDRILTAGTVTYGWDDDGRLVSRSGPDGVANVWDPDGRLIEVAHADGTVVEHVYDVDGQRVETTVRPPVGPVEVTRYLVETKGAQAPPTGQVLVDHDPSGTVLAHYVRAGNQLLATVRPSGVRHFHADGLGSTRLLTDGAGAVTDRYRYDAFGALLEHAGSDPNRFLFAGEPRGPLGQFYDNGARWLDPETGRFLSIDPIDATPDGEGVPRTGGFHRYLYAMGNPVDYTDPTGEITFSIGGLSVSLNIQGNLRATQGVAARGVLQRIQQRLASLGLRSVKELKRLRRAGQIPGGRNGYEIHHLIEQRLVRSNPALRRVFQSLDDIPGVNLTRAQHRAFTNAWRNAFPYRGQAGHIANPTTEQIVAAAQRIYANNPEYFRIIFLALL